MPNGVSSHGSAKAPHVLEVAPISSAARGGVPSGAFAMFTWKFVLPGVGEPELEIAGMEFPAQALPNGNRPAELKNFITKAIVDGLPVVGTDGHGPLALLSRMPMFGSLLTPSNEVPLPP